MSAAPSILAVSHSSASSGAERVLLRTLVAAQERGWRVHCLAPPGQLHQELAEAGIPAGVVPDLKLPAGPRPLALARLATRWARAAPTLRAAAANHDVVLANGLLALPPLRLAKVAAPVCWLVHDVILRRDWAALLRWCAPAVTQAIAVSAASAEPVRARGIPTVIVRNGVPWPVTPAGNPAFPPVIGNAAMLTSWKGQDVLLEAISTLRRDAVVELMGGQFPKDDPYIRRLRERAEQPDLAGRVRFLGHRADPLERMRSWSVAVSSSVDPEAAPLSVLEAMSIGVPVVATAHGGTVEVLGDSGLLVVPRDSVALAAAIESLLDDDELRSRCAAAGPATVANGLTQNGQAGELLDRLVEVARRATVGR
ncbi:MAG: glycosyltransferase family 4 protein [Geodermatophilaceae bacterium]